MADIRVGVGGWTFEPWRGTFYPADLSQKRELAFASRALTSIEINGTYYSTFKPESWRRWRDDTPDHFVFSVKASRFCTNRRVLAEAGDSVARFLGQGLTELGEKLGPINWQFSATKTFDAADFSAFLKLLPHTLDGLRLRHAMEVRNPAFAHPDFYRMARDHNVAIVYARDEDFPQIDEATADFTYARLMASREDLETGVSASELAGFAQQARAWAQRGDVFVYFISGAKVRNPAAAQALIATLGGVAPASAPTAGTTPVGAPGGKRQAKKSAVKKSAAKKAPARKPAKKAKKAAAKKATAKKATTKKPTKTKKSP